MNKVTKLITKNCGIITPYVIDEYVKTDGFKALQKALNMNPLEIIQEVKESKLMGRGGAGYPTGTKWEQALHVKNSPKYIMCNADEGEPGTFKDKIILDQDPLRLIEGMIIAGYVLNSNKGYIYIRGEYPKSQKIVTTAIENAKKAGFLGKNILNSGYDFDIEVLGGAGAYVVGENSALVESSEGNVGRPRIKPPYIKVQGLYKMPTLVNNVETFASISYIVLNGGKNYAKYGTDSSGGTKLICLSGNVNNRGVFEVPFGITLREIIYDIGQGIPENKKFKFAQIGGSSGACINEKMLDIPLCYKSFKENGISIGSGAILVADESNCVVDFLKIISEFFVHESCGKCTPCREGNKQILNILKKFQSGTATHEDYMTLYKLMEAMKYASFCGLGKSAPNALASCLKLFKSEFDNHIYHNCSANVCFSQEGVN
ncbi:NADH-quinone oxidoreductase subunit F [Haloimpatiens sp. FM7330]|uniref:complex I 51 kDa subunit family protein n=1 Tax=Haloimpatiens sp. FM7330 TaxID=3298610 RepID=UPI0036412036